MWGSLTRAEVMAVVQELIADSRFTPGLSELIDLEDATSTAITANDLRQLAASSLDPVARRAFVTTDALTFGLARMFEAHRKASQAPERIAVFKNLRDAEAWLGLNEEQ
jgi:hypothetical protein